MAEQEAVIRPYGGHNEDTKLVRFTVAKGRMEPLAVANFKVTTSPWAIAIWFAVSAAFVEFMHWWPDARLTVLGYLRPLPAFAVWALPIMFLVDWLQRPAFEKDSVDALRRADMVDIAHYYSRAPGSGIWLYHFGAKFVGLVAIDASCDALSDALLGEKQQQLQQSARARSKDKGKDEDADTAVIRHLYVVEPYRAADAQDDLLKYAVQHAFKSQRALQRIRISVSPLAKYAGSALAKEGFRIVGHGQTFGLFKWTQQTYELTRERWMERQEAQKE